MDNFRRILFVAALASLSACGGKSLTHPESLLVRSFSQDQTVNLTVVMKSCSDSCSTYEAGSCSVEHKGMVIKLSIDIPYSDKSGVNRTTMEGCSLASCGPQVLAHCDLGVLAPGTYTIEDDGFSSDITVQ